MSAPQHRSAQKNRRIFFKRLQFIRPPIASFHKWKQWTGGSAMRHWRRASIGKQDRKANSNQPRPAHGSDDLRNSAVQRSSATALSTDSGSHDSPMP
jgi:hypothetical protein